jgi:hypothetical protein
LNEKSRTRLAVVQPAAKSAMVATTEQAARTDKRQRKHIAVGNVADVCPLRRRNQSGAFGRNDPA